MDEWLTIRQAADRLGLSDLSVRRRIKDGRLAHRLVDGKYYVNLAPDPLASKPEVAPHADPPAISADSDYAGDQSPIIETESARDLAAVLPALTDLAERAGRAGALETRLQQLEARESELQGHLLTLATRNGWLESRLDERENTIKLLEDSRHRAPWWRRLFK